MASSRLRVLIMVGVLGLVAVLGVVWLVGVATGNPGEPQAGTGTSAPADGGDAVDGGADMPDGSTGDVPDQDGGVDDGRPPGNGSTSPGSGNNRRSVHWNGVRLDGSPGDDGCVTIINKTSTVGTIESVSFTVRSGPGRATAQSAPGHCEPTGDPLCQEVELRTGSQCLAGAIIKGDASDSPYVIQAVVHFRYMCVNVENSPCDQVGDWRGPPPTAEAPVEVTGETANNVPDFDYYIGGSDTSDGEDDSSTSPKDSPEPPPDDTGSPGTSEDDLSTQDDGSGISDEATTSGDSATTPEGE
jgi:hypothetical protein